MFGPCVLGGGGVVVQTQLVATNFILEFQPEQIGNDAAAYI